MKWRLKDWIERIDFLALRSKVEEAYRSHHLCEIERAISHCLDALIKDAQKIDGIGNDHDRIEAMKALRARVDGCLSLMEHRKKISEGVDLSMAKRHSKK